MQVITRNVLVFNSEDWERLSMLMADFNKVCNKPCELCPLRDFCFENPNPAEYLKGLHKFLSKD